MFGAFLFRATFPMPIRWTKSVNEKLSVIGWASLLRVLGGSTHRP